MDSLRGLSDQSHNLTDGVQLRQHPGDPLRVGDDLHWEIVGFADPLVDFLRGQPEVLTGHARVQVMHEVELESSAEEVKGLPP